MSECDWRKKNCFGASTFRETNRHGGVTPVTPTAYYNKGNVNLMGMLVGNE